MAEEKIPEVDVKNPFKISGEEEVWKHGEDEVEHPFKMSVGLAKIETPEKLKKVV